MTNAGQLLAEKSAYVNNGVQYVLKKNVRKLDKQRTQEAVADLNKCLYL